MTRNERYTCGEYDLSLGYYEQCGEPGGKGEDNFKKCAFDRKCADQCVKNYLATFIDADCGRGSADQRKCVDHGITHGQRQNACNARSDPYVQNYASYMVQACPGLDPIIIPGKGIKPGNHNYLGFVMLCVHTAQQYHDCLAGVLAAIITPTIILFLLILAAGVWWWRRQKSLNSGLVHQGW